MGDPITGIALLGEMAAIIALIALYDPSDYVESKHNSEEDWYPRLNSAFGIAEAKDLITNPEYTKAQALTDSAAAEASLFSKFGSEKLSGIYAMPCQVNGFNSTAAMLLANESIGSVVGEAVKVRLGTVGMYAQISQANINIFAQLLSVGKGTKNVVTVSSAPYGIDLGAMLHKVQESVGQYTGAVNASIDLQGTVAGFFGL